MRTLPFMTFALGLLVAVPATAQTVQGPIAGTGATAPPAAELEKLGYTTEEFFFSGDAASYVPAGDLGSDGKWAVKEGGKAPYTTRLYVVRPKDHAKFNGTVLVEWLNVSGGGDAAVDFGSVHREILRSGYAYVGVSAQRVGIYGSPNAASAFNLKKANPDRYEPLDHPGDAFSYDIFTQAGRLVREGKVTGGRKPKTVLASGESQSAGYMTTYVNAIDPLVRVFDGFLIHSRSGSSAKLNPDVTMPMPVKYRTDTRVPVLTFIAETDLMNGYYKARVPDSNKIRVWEVAGTSHADAYMKGIAFNDFGSLTAPQIAKGYLTVQTATGDDSSKQINAAPQHHYVMQAALDALNRWVVSNKLPPKSALLEITATEPPTYRLDATGNVEGGVRSPWQDAPLAVYSGLNDIKTGFGRLYGSTDYYGAGKLKQIYPGGRAEYLKRFNTSLEKNISAGFILKADAPEIRELAAAMYPGN